MGRSGKIIRFGLFSVLLAVSGCAKKKTESLPPPPVIGLDGGAEEGYEAEIDRGPAGGGGPVPVLPPVPGPAGGGGAPVADPRLSLVRYLSADQSRWKETIPRNLTNLYTRLEIVSSQPIGGAAGTTPRRSYRLERRSWLSRLISSRNIAISTLARAEIKDPDISVSLPLFAISHDSARGSGEVFVTSFTMSDMQAPLFRIGANSVLSVQLNTKITDKQKSDASAFVIQAVQSAVRIAAPTSSVLTSLSKDDVARTSKAFDSIVSGLMSQELTETIVLGRQLSSWDKGSEILVTGQVPGGLVLSDIDRQARAEGRTPDDKTIETWHIRFSCPRPSIFHSADLCTDRGLDLAGLNAKKAKIAQEVAPAGILQTHLSSQQTVQSFVQTQSWYTKFLEIKAKKPADTKGFCIDAAAALYAAGLTDFDAALVVRAMGEKMPGIATLDKAVAIPANCKLVTDAIPTS